MNRGVVLEVKRRYCVVLTPDGAYVKVPGAANHNVGEEIVFERTARRVPRAARLVSSGIAAALVLAFVLANIMPRGGPPVAAYVAMDINPSVEIGVTLEHKVIELRALNEDGERVVRGITYKKRPVAEVAAAIIDHAAAEHYLPEQAAEVLVTSMVMAKHADDAFEQKLVEEVDRAIVEAAVPAADKGDDGTAAAPPVEVAHVKAPVSLRDSAKESGVSPGKLAFYLLAEEKGLPVTIDELKSTSIRQAAEPYGGIEHVLGKDAEECSKQEHADLLEKREAEKQAAKAKQEAERKVMQ